MFLDILFQIWRRFSASAQWRLLWLFNSKYMVSVSGFVYDDNDQFLLLRHRHWVSDVWGLPGGIVEKNETLEDAFSREVLEETGVKITNVEMIDFVSGFNMRMEGYFRSTIDQTNGKHTIKIQEEEILEARFFSLNEYPENLLDTHLDLILKEADVRQKG